MWKPRKRRSCKQREQGSRWKQKKNCWQGRKTTTTWGNKKVPLQGGGGNRGPQNERKGWRKGGGKKLRGVRGGPPGRAGDQGERGGNSTAPLAKEKRQVGRGCAQRRCRGINPTKTGPWKPNKRMMLSWGEHGVGSRTMKRQLPSRTWGGKAQRGRKKECHGQGGWSPDTFH